MRLFKLNRNTFFLVLIFASCRIDILLGQDFYEYPDLSYISPTNAKKDSLQQLNLVVPKTCEECPLLIWVGGGAWSYGNRNEEMPFARKLALEDIAVASIGHRLSPAVWRDPKLNQGIQHPAHVNDLAAAVCWLVDRSDFYGYSKKKIVVGGYSSGAHLAALVSLDDSYLTNYGISKDVFKGVVPISGTYDLVNYYDVFLNGDRPELAEEHVMAVFGNTKEDLIQASPVVYLDNLATPILLMSDNRLYNYTRIFEDKIRKTGFSDLQVLYSHKLSHGELWKNLSFDDKSLFRNTLVDFICQVTERNPATAN